MDLWIVSKERGAAAFIGSNTVSLAGFEDIFEEDLATHGRPLMLRPRRDGEDMEVRGCVLPSYPQLRKSGLAKKIEERISKSLVQLADQLGGPQRVSSGETALVIGAVSVLDSLIRAKGNLKAIIVG